MFVTLLVMAMASLKLASVRWELAVAAALALSIFLALTTALLERGSRQALAMGFLVGVIGYFLMQREETFIPARLPTAPLLASLYDAINDSHWVDTETGERLPNFDPRSTPRKINKRNSRAVFVQKFVQTPPREEFMQIGHCWFATATGSVLASLASVIYQRRLARKAQAT